MTLSGTLQVSHDLGLCKNRGCNKQLKSVIGRSKLHLLSSSTLSSRVSFHQQQDSLSLHLSRKVYRPIHVVPYRCNAFSCRSFLAPGGAFEVPFVKTASAVLTKSYNALQVCPFIIRLVPAVGIIIFALWGLSPLLRHIRSIVLHKSDNNWKKSNTFYVATSYVQPLLLWTGAILICRTLDPIVLPSETSELIKQRLLNFIRSLSTVLTFAYCLSSVIQQAQKFFMETNDTSDARNMGFQFAGKAVYSAVWVAAVSLFMELLGFSTQKWLTAGGLGTVLLTLAGREIFTNFLSSAMIHATRPFVTNEWIQTKIEGYEVSGTVEHVGWWSPTIVRGEDREAVHIPNHKFTVNVVRNLTQKTHWRIKTHLAISHLDVNKINNIVADMRKVLAKNPQVEQQRLHRRVFLENINPENQALLILISCFVKTAHFEEYLCVKEAILLDLLRVISHHRARLATPIRTVQKIYGDADLENVPFSDSVFGRGGVASNRPLLLIEPHYKVSGEDKTKAQSKAPARQSPPETKADIKGGATPISDPKADAKNGEMSNSGSDDSKPMAPSTSDPKVGEKGAVKSTAKSGPKTNSKVAELSSSDSKASNSVPDYATQKISEVMQPRKACEGDVKQNSKVKSPVSSSEVGAGTEGGLLATSHSKQEAERSPVGQPLTPRPALEENIVLGVALEGSKRTLPIEEGIDFPSIPAESKEFAARGNGNLSPTGNKDKKDGQISATRSATSSDK